MTQEWANNSFQMTHLFVFILDAVHLHWTRMSSAKQEKQGKINLENGDINSQCALSLDSQHHTAISAIGKFFSTRHLCLQSKWLNMMEITDISQRRMFLQCLFCPVDGRMIAELLRILKLSYFLLQHLVTLPAEQIRSRIDLIHTRLC